MNEHVNEDDYKLHTMRLEMAEAYWEPGFNIIAMASQSC